jgi:hypothetical protein
MTKKGVNRREFITECSLKLAGASVLLNQSGAKPAFGKEKKPKPEKNKEPTMEYRSLGKTGLKVSAVSFGTTHLRDPAVLLSAIDLGINFFDTAPSYAGGNSERMLGQVAKDYGREKIFISTKIRAFEPENKPSKKFRVLEHKALDLRMEGSLKQLQTDYVDVLFVGVMHMDWIVNEALLSYLEKLKREGKARFVGISHHEAGIYADVAEHVSKPNIYDVLLTWLDFQSPPEEIEALRKARKKGVGIIAMKTQAGGYEVAKGSPLSSLSPHQAALKWVLNQDFVDCAVPGMRNIEQIVENVGVVGKKMGWNDRKTLYAYHNAIKHKYCIMCGKCLKTCGNRINIPTINRALMYCEGHRDFAKGRRTYLKLSKRKSGLSCMNCTSPTCKCANSITIAERMKHAHALFA